MLYIKISFLTIITVALAWRVVIKSSGNDKKSNSVKENNLVLDSTVLGVKTIVSNLDVPWEILWGPDNQIWLTEQKGLVSKVDPETGKKKILLQLSDVYNKKSYGLLGFAIHPDFKEMPYVYLDYTYLKLEALRDTSLRDSSILSKIVRYTYSQDSLINPKIIFENIPGNTYHNGCRLIITPDRKIMFTTGDAGHPKFAQEINRLNGKILRLNLDGSIPSDNPFKNNPVWSYGHRNAQGLVFSPTGVLYSSENGDAQDDELNIIHKGSNYGWPNVEGFCDQPTEKDFCSKTNITEPLKVWTPTIAPSGIDFYPYGKIPEWKNSIIMGTLKGNSLRVLKLSEDGKRIVDDQIYFDHLYGRIRDVCVSPKGDVYISTSNRDWNPSEGFPRPGDDRIIKLYKLSTLVKSSSKANVKLSKTVEKNTNIPNGKNLYISYCASCHKSNGEGVAETFPPLRHSQTVLGDKNRLINLVLNGRTGAVVIEGKTYNQGMPSFKFLNNKDLAAILTYIRNDFGESASDISINDINLSRN